MSTCRYCEHWQQSKWRINPDDEEGKKKKLQLRHCSVIQKYIKGELPSCQALRPNHIFWCDNNDCWLAIEGCLHRKRKGEDETCFRCSQHATIIDMKRCLGMLKRLEAAAIDETDVPKKPMLLKRKPEA